MGKRILIVNVNWIGDVIFSTPFIRAVREAYPDAYIACLLHPRCKDILESNPRLDEIIFYDEEGSHKSLVGKWRLIKQLKARKFDTAFLLHRSFTKALITLLAGIKERIGYPNKNRGWVLTKAVEEPDEELHKVEYFLNIAKSAGIKPLNTSYEYFVDNGARKYISSFLKDVGVSDEDRIILLCPGGNWGPKRWAAEKFAKLGEILGERFKAKIILAASAKDAGLAVQINELMGGKAIVAAGKTDLKQLGALLERSELVVANDTGPMHMASALGVKTIALFGPTSPRITGPYGTGAWRIIWKNERCETPCYDVTCIDNICMDAITVEDVVREAERLLG
ncbi:MAG: lipopolysaccharide heptosyltransferase II [Candidatus Omnitrophica bacterium]|nr:lipopolysaccharide heptosyltransferase II [Candidatus Omnitrophota bacterium]MCM8790935.1 lipopolysaccharide heptosyltransferase II [Candidatus Omnitrophota bacterium]